MSDGGRERALLGVEVWKSSQKSSVQRSAVRSIAWLDAGRSRRTALTDERYQRRNHQHNEQQLKRKIGILVPGIHGRSLRLAGQKALKQTEGEPTATSDHEARTRPHE